MMLLAGLIVAKLAEKFVFQMETLKIESGNGICKMKATSTTIGNGGEIYNLTYENAAQSLMIATNNLEQLALQTTETPDKASRTVPQELKPPKPIRIAWLNLIGILTHPITFLPVTGMVIIIGAHDIYTGQHMPTWAIIALLLSYTSGEIAFWCKYWNEIYGKIECSLEIVYRTTFNENLSKTATPYGKVGKETTNLLKEAIVLKEGIEAKIFVGNRLTPKEKEILSLLEETVTRIGETNKSPTKETPKEIKEALTTLTELSENLDSVLRPLHPTSEEKNMGARTKLNQSIHGIRNHMDESKQVRRLIQEVKAKA